MKSPTSQGRALLVLGIPLIGGHLAQFAIQMTDTIMLGWYSVAALAAAVLGGLVFFIQFIFLSGFAMAVVPIVASAAEKGDDIRVRRVTRMAMWLSAISGLATLPIFFFGGPILTSLGQPPETVVLAANYMQIAGFGMVPALLVMVLKSYLSALERTAVILWITVGAAVVNVLVNYTLIFGNFGMPELGVRGAAIASVAVQVVTIVSTVIYAAWVEPKYALFQRIWRPDWAVFRNIFYLGWPIGLTALSEIGLFSASAVMIGWIGTIELAAHSIAIQLASIVFLIHFGLSNAATIRVGQAWGRGDYAAMRAISVVAFRISGVFGFITIAIFLLFGTELVGIFIDPADPARDDVIATGVILLGVAAVFQLADAGQVQALGLLRGMHDTRVPMVIAAVSYWLIGIPASYLFGFVLEYGAAGIWSGLVVGLSVAGLLLAWRLYLLAWRQDDVKVL